MAYWQLQWGISDCRWFTGVQQSISGCGHESSPLVRPCVRRLKPFGWYDLYLDAGHDTRHSKAYLCSNLSHSKQYKQHHMPSKCSAFTCARGCVNRLIGRSPLCCLHNLQTLSIVQASTSRSTLSSSLSDIKESMDDQRKRVSFVEEPIFLRASWS